MKIEGEIAEAALNGGAGTVTVRQLWQGVPVFSCQMVFVFRDNELISLSGTVLAPGESSVENSRLLTLPSALLSFMDGILSGGDVCSAVESMAPGYRMVQSFSGMMRLEPVWLISGNTADYYMDAVTGELSRLTGK
jgi:regulatory protein YycI of two-component signal transduction system YycFG